MRQRFKGALDAYIQLVLRHRGWVIVAALVFTAIAASGARFLGFSMEYRVFFGGSDPHVAAFDALQRTYSKNDGVLFVLAPASGEVFTRGTLAAVERLTQAGWRLPYVTRVDSITNYQHSYARGDELVVEDLVHDIARLDDRELARIEKIAIAEPFLVNRLVSPQGHVTGVNVTLRLPGQKLESETQEVVAAARALADWVRAEHPGMRIYLTGTMMISNAFYEATRDDLMGLMPIMLVVLLIILALLLRSVGGTLATFIVIGLSNAVALGLGAWFGIKLTPPSAAAAPIVMTLAIADCVHVFSTYVQGLRGKLDRVAAMAQSLRLNFWPVTLTSVTTAIGFATMNFADSPPFHDLGNLVVLGVLAAYLFSLTLFPAVVTLLPVHPSAQSTFLHEKMRQFADFIVRRHAAVMWVTLTVTVGLLIAIPKNELNDEFLKYFDESITFRTDNDYITENLTGVYQIEYSLPAGKSGGINEPEYLRTLEEFARWFRTNPRVWHVDTFTDVVKRVNKSMHGDDPRFYRVPDNRAEAAQYLLLFEMSLPFGLDLNDRINIDKSATKFVVSLHTMSANELLGIERRADEWLTQNAPAYMRAVGTGPAVLFAHIGAQSIRTGLLQGFVALVLISVLLIFALRSLRIGLVSLVPNLIPACMAFGLWGLVNGQINMALSTVVGMTLGIVVDDTIHLLTKYLYARRERGDAPPEAVRYAIAEVGVAVVVTTVVLVAGFLVLTASPFAMNWGMGLLTAITVVFALIADLLVLPGLILRIETEGAHEKVAVAASRA